MNKIIKVSDDTLYTGGLDKQNGLSGISAGNFLSVSGAFWDDDVILASRIELLQEPTISLSGKIADLDTNAQTFKISGVTISYSFFNIDIGALINGIEVWVSAIQVGGRIELFTVVERLDKLVQDNAKILEVKGAVSGFESVDKRFSVNNQTIKYTNATQIINMDFALGDNSVVVVKGELVDGTLQAFTIDVIAPSS